MPSSLFIRISKTISILVSYPNIHNLLKFYREFNQKFILKLEAQEHLNPGNEILIK